MMFRIPSISFYCIRSFSSTSILERARIMTMIRKKKIALDNAKKKAERHRKNPPPIPDKLVLMLKYKGLWDNRHLREKDELPVPSDDVYSVSHHTWPRYEPKEALDLLREHYEPEIFDNPNALLKIKVEFDMTGSKSSRYIDGYFKMIPIYHKYDENIPSKSVCVFVADEEQEKIAKDSGAGIVGGDSLIQDIAKGRIDVTDVEYFIAHDDMTARLKPVNSLLRDKLPRKLNGTLGTDIEYMVKTFRDGHKVEIKKFKPSLVVEDEPDYGCCSLEMGRLSMENDKLIENLNGVLQALSERSTATKVSRADYITRAQFYVDEDFPIKYSILHPLIKDKKGRHFKKDIEEQGEQIKTN